MSSIKRFSGSLDLQPLEPSPLGSLPNDFVLWRAVT